MLHCHTIVLCKLLFAASLVLQSALVYDLTLRFSTFISDALGLGESPVGPWKSPVGSGESPVGPRESPVGSGESPVGSGESLVGPRESPVGSGESLVGLGSRQ
jgi:hypothetical protein